MNEKDKNRLPLGERLRYAIKRYKGITIETDLTEYRKIVADIRTRDLSGKPDHELKRISKELRDRAIGGETLDTMLVEAFVLVTEVAARIVGLDAFDEQLIAGIVLHRGKLSQMRTGEGKTLAAVFPVYLNALSGAGVHVFTANEYLAKRDAEWMGGIYRFLGLTVASVQGHLSPEAKREAYGAEVIYLTAKQAGFDFLRDGLQFEPGKRVQREYSMCLVDEADFIMIDEARIPLVIARETDQSTIDPVEVDDIVRRLSPDFDYTVDRVGRNCVLTRDGQRRVAEALGCGGMHEAESLPFYAAANVSLHAHHLLSRDVDYIVRNGRIDLVDEFTGRVAEKRQWPYGIHTALEVKERLRRKRQGEVCGSITIQHFIRLYRKIAAMTATAISAADELNDFYDLATVVIPPRRKDRMLDLDDSVFTSRAAKFDALVCEIDKEHKTGRPILVGTGSIKESIELSSILSRRGVPHEVLNASNDEKEASIVAEAGMLGAVTISTNMAGRGTDIQLGGPKGIDQERVAGLGGLYVMGTNRHESIRIDQQLRGRGGRQGEPGSSRFFTSLEDDLIVRYAITDLFPKEYLTSDDPNPISDRRVSKEIERSQSIIERQHFQMRRTLRRYTMLVEKQRHHLQGLRAGAIDDGIFPEELLTACEGSLDALLDNTGEEQVEELLAILFAESLDAFWTRHLAWIDDIREGIHLRMLGKENPLLAFLNDTSKTYQAGIAETVKSTAERLARVGSDPGEIERLRQKITAPSSTWTYMINDNPFPLFRIALLGSDVATGAAFAAQMAIVSPFLLLLGVFRLAKRAVTAVIGSAIHSKDAGSS
jgi:preprotein translocase subunit SecA